MAKNAKRGRIWITVWRLLRIQHQTDKSKTENVFFKYVKLVYMKMPNEYIEL